MRNLELEQFLSHRVRKWAQPILILICNRPSDGRALLELGGNVTMLPPTWKTVHLKALPTWPVVSPPGALAFISFMGFIFRSRGHSPDWPMFWVEGTGSVSFFLAKPLMWAASEDARREQNEAAPSSQVAPCLSSLPSFFCSAHFRPRETTFRLGDRDLRGSSLPSPGCQCFGLTSQPGYF